MKTLTHYALVSIAAKWLQWSGEGIWGGFQPTMTESGADT